MGCHGRAQRNNIAKLADARAVVGRRKTSQTTQELSTQIGLTLIEDIRGPGTGDNDQPGQQLTGTTLVLHGEGVPVQDAQQLVEGAEVLAEVVNDDHGVRVVALPPLERLAGHPHLGAVGLRVATEELQRLGPRLASLAGASAAEKPVVLRLPRALRLHVLDRGLGVLEALHSTAQEKTQKECTGQKQGSTESSKGQQQREGQPAGFERTW